jgi:hypothetical protein
MENIGANSIFFRIHRGPITIKKRGIPHWEYPATWGNGYPYNEINIWSAGNFFSQYDSNLTYNGEYGLDFASRYYKNFIIHETGHCFDNAIGGIAGPAVHAAGLDTGGSNIANGFYMMRNDPSGQQWQFRGSEEHYEYFADMFLGWVKEKWEEIPGGPGLTQMGNRRKDFMDENMAKWIFNKVGMNWARNK